MENCKVEIPPYTINSKNLCIFALRSTCFPSEFSGPAVFSVVKGSHTDLHRFDPRRPYSIKTRIKTSRSALLMCAIRTRRPYSIKTRIKTVQQLMSRSSDTLADHIPLKQGLRLCCRLEHKQAICSRRPYSIKTRIKTSNRWYLQVQDWYTRRPYSIKTRIKTALLLSAWCLCLTRRPYSIKTRIKTPDTTMMARMLHPRRPYSIKTRIKTKVTFVPTDVFASMARRPYSIKTRIKTLQG